MDGRDALSNEAPAEGRSEMALHVLAYNLTRVMGNHWCPTPPGGDEAIAALINPA